MPRPALVPELYVSDLDASLEFYLHALGFRVEYDRPEERFAAVSLGDAHLMLEEAPSLSCATAEEFRQGEWRTAALERPFGRGLNLEIRVDDLDAVRSRLESKNQVLLLDVHERIYQLRSSQRRVRQLLVADPDGYLIRMSEFLVETSAS